VKLIDVSAAAGKPVPDGKRNWNEVDTCQRNHRVHAASSFDDDGTYPFATLFRWEHAMTSTTMNSPSGIQSDSAAQTLVQNWWLFTLRGIFGIIFGCIALIFPGPTMLSLVIVFSAYMLVDGVAGIISAVRAIRKKDRWGLLLFEGLLNIAVGIVAFLWPGMTVIAFVLLVAAWAIVSGALMTAAGFRLNVPHGRWWLVLGGLLSLAYGALLVATPLIGAIVLTWWMGAYALVFGVALVVFSFKLRSRQQRVNPTAVAA
jgi:uncharacterized membrane protein HdeD (DUF308 family)